MRPNVTSIRTAEKSDLLRLKDVRATFRLIAECRELGRDPLAWRRHMLDGLRLLVGAQVGLYLQLRNPLSAAELIAEPLDSGFLEPAHRGLWAHHQRESAHRDDPFHLRFFGDFTGALRTRSLESVVDMSEWRRCRHYNEYNRACGLEDRITSALRLDVASPSAFQVVVLHRSAADGMFPPRAVRLAQVFCEELRLSVGRQLSMTALDPEVAALPFQLQQVLACLLQGDAEKQIADRIGISRHTVNRHLHRLYVRFGVHSRGELMFRCRDMLALLPANPRKRSEIDS